MKTFTEALLEQVNSMYPLRGADGEFIYAGSFVYNDQTYAYTSYTQYSSKNCLRLREVLTFRNVTKDNRSNLSENHYYELITVGNEIRIRPLPKNWTND